MNPLLRRKIVKFTHNKKSYRSFIALCILAFVSLFCEFIANENPWIVKYKDQYYFPIFKAYIEKDFDGPLSCFANFKDPYLRDIIEKKGWILFPPIPFSPTTVNDKLTQSVPAPPSTQNWLGTDDQGRDVLTRLLYGYRTSLCFGFVLTLVSGLIALFFGSLQGYRGGKFDLICQRFIEVWSGLPILYLLIVVSSIITPSFYILLIIMSLFNWMFLASVVRTEFFRVRVFDYVKAAQAMGLSSFKIIIRHILPNAVVACITFLPFILNTSISTLTSLDFLGFGLPPGEPSLGELIVQGKNNHYATWLGLTAFFSIGALLTLLIFIGEGMRDAFDTRKI